MDLVHAWYDNRYLSKILCGTIPTPIHDLKVKVTDIEVLCWSFTLKVLGPHYFPNPEMDLVHVWYDDRYWLNILRGTIPTQVHDLMLKFSLICLGPHYFQTLWWIKFMFGMMKDTCPKLYNCIKHCNPMNCKILKCFRKEKRVFRRADRPYCTTSACCEEEELVLIPNQYTKWATTWQNQENECAPAKTQISLGIRPVWSESSLCAQWVARDPTFLHAEAKTLIRMGGCPGWADSTLGAHAILLD